MKKFVILIVFSLVLAACAGTEITEPTPTVPEPPVMAETETAPTVTPEASPINNTCPTATDDTYVLRDPRHGFCLLYPTTHKVERPTPQEVVLVVGSLLNSGDPRASIIVTPLGGQTVAAVADEIVAGFEGFEITRADTTVAGEPAIILDGLPGQDINRRVLFAHDDLLYEVYISPVDPADTTAIDAFAEGVLGSFAFIPVSDTLSAADECVEPKPGLQSITSDEFGFCFLAPDDFTYEQPSETNANLFVGSMMNVEHPKLMIEVTDDGGMDAAAAASELVASFEGFEIPRTFGQSLGYEPAERLDGMPGQDLGRVLYVVHDDRLFRFTFVPNDPTQGDVYTEMESLFTLVMNTFRFLP